MFRSPPPHLSKPPPALVFKNPTPSEPRPEVPPPTPGPPPVHREVRTRPPRGIHCQPAGRQFRAGGDRAKKNLADIERSRHRADFHVGDQARPTDPRKKGLGHRSG